MRSKYRAKKIIVDGLSFDSKKEARRYKELKALQMAGAISCLQRQFKFVLIPSQREPDSIGARGGLKKGKLIEREVVYIADFTYIDLETDKLIVEDVKGFRTPEYIIKRKLMLYLKNIRIKET
jgi:hypothetical protein